MTADDVPAPAAEFSPDRRRRIGARLTRSVLSRFLGPQQAMRASQFARLGVPPGHVVLLGDSNTDFGLWQEWFAWLPVLNLGICG